MSKISNLITRINNRLATFTSLSSATHGCDWPTDIHSHMLAGVDDGLTTHEEVLVCLRQYVAWGIRHIITTPHINQIRYPNSHATLLTGQAALRKMIDIYQLPLTIEVAAEYMVDELFLALLNEGELLNFGRQRYVLIEIGWDAAPAFLDTILFQMQIKGYQPLLAHPERYVCYYNNIKSLGKLRDMGCLFQLNWGSLIGQYGQPVKKQAQQIIDNKWVDFVGSDLHSADDLPLFQTFLDSAAYRQLNRLPLRNKTFIADNQIGR
jgi:protein-tyrosine phosphatase